MPAKIKMRSASVEDLGSIVKQMIDGVLEDNDQVAKLHQAVFEEYYVKKLEELKQVKAEIDADHRIDNQAKNPSLTVIESSKFGETISNSQIIEHKISSGSPINNELDSPTVRRVIRRQKYIRVTGQETTNVNHSNIALGSPNDNTTVDLTKNENDAVISKKESKKEIDKAKKTLSNPEIIEWRSSLFQKGETEKNGHSEKTREIPVQFKSKGEMAFENWKKEKNNTYRRIFREDYNRKRMEKASNAREIEKKEAANAAYLYWRRQQDARQKLSNKRKRILVEMETQKLQSNERRSANSQAFKAWKRQKDVKLREKKMYMMAYSQQNYPQERPKSEKPKQRVNVTFNMWLDQLDSVLHQKYLRERRYLVHSFYCQPAYFGTAALCRT